MHGFQKLEEGDLWNTEPERTADAGPTGALVLRRIGNPDTLEGKRIARTYGDLENARLRLVEVPDLHQVRTALVTEFPHARAVAETLLAALAGRQHVHLRPTVLIGNPGCGKTSFSVRMLELLGVPHRIFPCGGSSDASLAGNPRRWQTSEPSLPVTLFRDFEVASPGIILDELEKVATSRQNGSLHDALISLLETRSAARWLDPYLEAEVDLSHVVWLGTANSLDGVPGPLRDRCRFLRFPDPGQEHLPTLANALLRGVVAERGWDPAWALPLDGLELQALARHWPGGSLRRLARLVEAILAARDAAQGLQ